jgi:hypothetical protein
MNRTSTMSALCLAALSLSACGQHEGRRANAYICFDFKSAPAAPATGAALGPPAEAVALEDCVRRWAYSLAPARDSAETVSGAVVAACGGTLARWNQQSLTQQPPGAPEESLSIRTGQPTNPLAEHNAFAGERALFYVVQARAGHCAPPPTSKGVPTGVTN